MKLNLPNKLVILRVFMTIAIIGLLIAMPYAKGQAFVINCPGGLRTIHLFNVIGLSLFVAASFTDFLDGHIARKQNIESNFGKLFDPIADKILVNSVLIIFTVYARIPVAITLAFIIRDLLVEGLRMSLGSKGTVLSARWAGKVKTVLQMVGISALFLWFPEMKNGGYDWTSIYNVALIPLYGALVVSLYSGFLYYKDGFKEVING